MSRIKSNEISSKSCYFIFVMHGRDGFTFIHSRFTTVEMARSHPWSGNLLLQYVAWWSASVLTLSGTDLDTRCEQTTYLQTDRETRLKLQRRGEAAQPGIPLNPQLPNLVPIPLCFYSPCLQEAQYSEESSSFLQLCRSFRALSESFLVRIFS